MRGNIGDIIGIACLDCNKAIRDECAKTQSKAWTIEWEAFVYFKMIRVVSEGSNLLEFVKNLRNRGGGELIDAVFVEKFLVFEEIERDFCYFPAPAKRESPMANNKSAEKRVRQIAKRTEKNRASKSRIKTLQKKAIAASEEGKTDEALKAFQEFTSAVDKATKNNIFQKNKAANMKSRTNKVIKPA